MLKLLGTAALMAWAWGRKTLPTIIDATHAEAFKIHVLDAAGGHLKNVRSINTKDLTVEQYVGIVDGTITRNADGSLPIDTVAYAELRMIDGRDVMEALGE